MKNWIKTHKIQTVLAVIFGPFILLMLIGALTGAGSVKSPAADKVTTAPNSTPQKTPETKSDPKPALLAKVGEAVRDGKFEFTVNNIECGRASVGTNEYLTKKAQGQFCLLNITAKNIGDKAQYLDGSSQFLYDASGAKFSSDTTASLYANPDSSTFYNQINPGNSVAGAIVFDISNDRKPVKAELHDSAFSGGVKISLE